MDKWNYQDILELINNFESFSKFDLYYIGFISNYSLEKSINELALDIVPLAELYQEKFLELEGKIEQFVLILPGMIEYEQLPEVQLDSEADKNQKLIEYFQQINNLIDFYETISKLELFYLGNFHARYPSFSIEKMFDHVKSLQKLHQKKSNFSEEDQINFLVKILTKKLQDQATRFHKLIIPQGPILKTQNLKFELKSENMTIKQFPSENTFENRVLDVSQSRENRTLEETFEQNKNNLQKNMLQENTHINEQNNNFFQNNVEESSQMALECLIKKENLCALATGMEEEIQSAFPREELVRKIQEYSSPNNKKSSPIQFRTNTRQNSVLSESLIHSGNFVEEPSVLNRVQENQIETRDWVDTQVSIVDKDLPIDINTERRSSEKIFELGNNSNSNNDIRRLNAQEASPNNKMFEIENEIMTQNQVKEEEGEKINDDLIPKEVSNPSMTNTIKDNQPNFQMEIEQESDLKKQNNIEKDHQSQSLFHFIRNAMITPLKEKTADNKTTLSKSQKSEKIKSDTKENKTLFSPISFDNLKPLTKIKRKETNNKVDEDDISFIDTEDISFEEEINQDFFFRAKKKDSSNTKLYYGQKKYNFSDDEELSYHARSSDDNQADYSYGGFEEEEERYF